MNDIENLLRGIGLTDYEIKVYLSLLKIGKSTKKNIIKESKISSSKLYEVMDKLADKGLVSSIKENGVLHFRAAHPKRIADYLKEKKEAIEKQIKSVDILIPSFFQKNEEMPKIQVFTGWRGLQTAYELLFSSLRRNEYHFVIGASQGEDIQMTRRFYSRLNEQRKKQGLRVKMIADKRYIKELAQLLGTPHLCNFRTIDNDSPSEISFAKGRVIIAILSKTPTAIVIEDAYTYRSFSDYFDAIWKSAKQPRDNIK